MWYSLSYFWRCIYWLVWTRIISFSVLKISELLSAFWSFYASCKVFNRKISQWHDVSFCAATLWTIESRLIWLLISVRNHWLYKKPLIYISAPAFRIIFVTVITPSINKIWVTNGRNSDCITNSDNWFTIRSDFNWSGSCPSPPVEVGWRAIQFLLKSCFPCFLPCVNLETIFQMPIVRLNLPLRFYW